MYKPIAHFLFALPLLVLPLSGCGIKPSSVDPPPGAENLKFPRTYPDLSTDPGPQRPPQ